jgi:hypothetical protein
MAALSRSTHARQAAYLHGQLLIPGAAGTYGDSPEASQLP